MFAAITVVSLSGTALAHGPTRQKVTANITINAPADKVWALVAKFQDMSWHPAVAKTEGSGGNDVGAKRTLTLQSGGTIEEELTKYSAAKRAFSYEIKAVDVKVLPVNNYSATLSVTDDGGKTVVEWRSAFYRGFMNNDPPPELSDEAAVKAVEGVFNTGLAALKKKAEAAG
ncbi:MAG: SRPBCC family protein [Hyphomicrobium aestuarii]|nr:SRPBCC family protein [Hyphomicrobium aestuarii]